MSAIDDLIKKSSSGQDKTQGGGALDSLIKKYTTGAEEPAIVTPPKPSPFKTQEAEVPTLKSKTGETIAGVTKGTGGGSAFDFHVVTPQFSVKEEKNWYG